MRAELPVTALGLLVACGCASHDGNKAPPLGLARWLPGASEASSEVPPAPAPSAGVGAPSPERSSLPRVSLSGEARPVEAMGADSAAAYARAARAWIYERPSEDAKHIGYLRAGGSVAV